MECNADDDAAAIGSWRRGAGLGTESASAGEAGVGLFRRVPGDVVGQFLVSDLPILLRTSLPLQLSPTTPSTAGPRGAARLSSFITSEMAVNLK